MQQAALRNVIGTGKLEVNKVWTIIRLPCNNSMKKEMPTATMYEEGRKEKPCTRTSQMQHIQGKNAFRATLTHILKTVPAPVSNSANTRAKSENDCIGN